MIAANSVRYPDVAVTCTPVNDRDDILPDPVAIIEVLSPSTECVDRGRKKIEYFAIASLWHYATIELDERLVDLNTRTDRGWVTEVMTGDATLKLTALGIEIPLDPIYEDTELDPTRRQEDGSPPPAR